MNSTEIERALRSDPIVNEIFVGVFAANHLPLIKEFPGGYIANTDESNSPGQHWVAFFCENNSVESFDSFGQNPVVYSNHIENWLSDTYNIVQCETLQSDDTTVCGQYCMFFILLRSHGFSYEDVMSALTRRREINDQFICKFINKFFRLRTTVRDKTFLIKTLLSNGK